MMIRSLAIVALLPAALGAQQVYVGLNAGRNSAQLSGDRTHSGPAVGVFAQADMSEHVGVGWGVSWLRSAVEDYVEPWSSVQRPIAEPAYLVTDLVGRLSWRSGTFRPLDATFGVTAFGGGWLGVRTGGEFVAPGPRSADFGHVWGVSFFAIQDPVKLEVSVRAYHGEREIWEGGPKQRGSPAFVGIAYRVR